MSHESKDTPCEADTPMSYVWKITRSSSFVNILILKESEVSVEYGFLRVCNFKEKVTGPVRIENVPFYP